MTKYHITKKGEVAVCDAKVKCRLGGTSGKENHFTNKVAAEKAAEIMLKSKYSELGSVSRSSATGTKPQGSLDRLSARGVHVNRVPSTDSTTANTAHPGVSQVDVIGEGAEKELLKQIMSGQRKISF